MVAHVVSLATIAAAPCQTELVVGLVVRLVVDVHVVVRKVVAPVLLIQPPVELLARVVLKRLSRLVPLRRRP